MLAAVFAGCHPAPAADTVEVELQLDVIPCQQCVSTVHVALDDFDGVAHVLVREGTKDIRVRYDPSRTDVDAILRALAAAGEPAKRK